VEDTRVLRKVERERYDGYLVFLKEVQLKISQPTIDANVASLRMSLQKHVKWCYLINAITNA